MATRTLSTKIAVEGEAEYKRAIASINSELSTQKSNLALVESAYKDSANSLEALTAKGSALSAMYEKQKEKVGSLESALKNAQTAQSDYATRVSAARDNIEKCEKALTDLKNSTGDTTEEQAALTKELDKWNTELTESEKYEAAAEKGVNNWQKQLNYANVELNDLSSEVKKNNKYLGEAEESADGCAKSIDQYGKKVKNAGEESETFGKKSKSAVTALSSVLVTAGVAASVKEIASAMMECVEASSEFGVGIAKISTIADQSKASLDNISGSILEMSGETAKSSTSLAEATYSAISAGVDTASAVEFVGKATKLAAGGFTEAETAVDVLTTALNAYGLSVEETERVSDILITTQNLGKTTVDELANSVGKVIPLAAAYGVEMDNLGAAYAVLTANGVATAEAGTYLKAMLNELGKSSSTVAKVIKEETGMSFAGLMASGYSLGDVLDVLGQSVGGDATAFNELWSSTEAGVGALSIFNKGAENFNNVLGSMQNSAGATSAAYDAMANTTEFAQKRMTTAIDNLKIAIGTQLDPALNTLYDTGTEAFSWATDFVNENPWIVSAIGALIAGLGTLAVGLTVATVGVSAATAAFSALSAAMIANPIGLVVAGVTALVGALSFLAISLDSADAETKAFISGLEDSKAAYDELSESIEGEQQTTESLTSALETALAAEEKTAAQKDVILDMVNQLNEAVPELGLAYDTTSDSINMTTESLDALIESAAAQEEYEAQISRISELETERADITRTLTEAEDAYNAALEAGAWNTGTLKNNVDELTTAQAANAEQIAALEEQSASYGEWQAASKVATAEMTATVNELNTEMVALQASYVEAQTKAKESIDQQLGLFNQLDGSAKTSIDSLIETLKGQCTYMDEYATNINKAMELGVDEGLIQKLSDGSEESAQILASIVQGGSEEIAALNEELAKVDEGKEKFSTTVAEMETDFSAKMTDLEARIGKTVETLNVSTEAGAAGAATIQGYIDGAEGMRQALVAKYAALAQAANAAYKNTLQIKSPSRVFREDGKNSMRGAILGAEDERANLEQTYEAAARSAVEAFERGLPSAIEEPNAAAIADRQTSAIVKAVSGNKQGDSKIIVNNYSPEALDEKTSAREFKKAQRDLSLGVS